MGPLARLQTGTAARCHTASLLLRTRLLRDRPRIERLNGLLFFGSLLAAPAGSAAGLANDVSNSSQKPGVEEPSCRPDHGRQRERDHRLIQCLGTYAKNRGISQTAANQNDKAGDYIEIQGRAEMLEQRPHDRRPE